MTPEEAIRILRLIRYAPRPPTISWLGRQAGYSPQHLVNIERAGTMSQATADRLAPVFKLLQVKDGQIAYGTLGRLGAGPDAGPRGGPGRGAGRPARRKDKARTRSKVKTENVRPINDMDPSTR